MLLLLPTLIAVAVATSPPDYLPSPPPTKPPPPAVPPAVQLVCLLSSLNDVPVPIVGYSCRTACDPNRNSIVQLKCAVLCPAEVDRVAYEDRMCGAIAALFSVVVTANGYVQYCVRVGDELWINYVPVPARNV